MADNTFLGTETLPDITPTSDEKTMAILSHVLTFVAPILAPLIIYIIKKNESEFVAYHAKESFNFQLTFVLIILALVFTVLGIIFLGWIVGIYSVVLVIMATVRASEGKLYKYPFSIKFIK